VGLFGHIPYKNKVGVMLKKNLIKLLISIFIGIIYIGCGNGNGNGYVNNSSTGTAYLGNLADANVSIYEFDSGGLTKTLKWNEITSSGDTLDEIGKFNTHSEELDKNKLYLYEVTGGIDFDSDDDGIKDTHGSENNGTIRALVKGSIVDALGDDFSVNYLTEYIFQNIKDSIGNDDFEEKEQSLLADIFASNNSDVFKYIPYSDIGELKANFEDNVVKNLIEGIKSGNKQKLNGIVTLNNATIMQDKIGLNSTIKLKLDINTTVPMSDIMVVANLDDGTELPITMIRKITPNINEYNIDIDVIKDDEDNISDTNISIGTHSMVISLNGLDKNITTNQFETTKDSQAKIDGMNVSDEEEDSASTLERSLTKTTSLKPEIKLSYDDDNITIRSSLQIKNPCLDKNISNLNISSSIKVAGDIIDLPMEELHFDDNNSDENLTNMSILTIPIPTVYPNSIRNISLNVIISKNNLATIITKIAPSLIANQSDLFDATIIVYLKTKDGDIVDTYEYPLNLFLDRAVLTLLEQNLTDLISGNVSIEDLLNHASSSNIGGSSSIPGDTSIEDLLNQVSSSNAGGSSIVLNRGLINKKGIKKVDYSKKFSAKNYGKRFGSGIYGKGRAWLDIDGMHMTTYLSAKAKVFKNFRMLKFNFAADVAPGSFDDTGYDVGVSVWNSNNIYTKSGSLADIIPSYSHPSKDKNSSEDSNSTTASDNNLSEDSNITTTVDTNSSAYKEAIKASHMIDANETIQEFNDAGHPTLLGYQDDFTNDVTTSYSQTAFIGVIPVYIEAGATATIGVDAGLGLSGITSMQGYIRPHADIDGFVEAGLGSGFKIFKKIGVDFRVGIHGDMYLAKEAFKCQVDGSLDLKGNDDYITDIVGSLHEKIKNTFQGPSTDVKTFIKYYGPSKTRIEQVINGDRHWWEIFKYWDHRYYKRTLTSWTSYKHTHVLLNKTQNLFDIPLGTDLAADSPDPLTIPNINIYKNILFAHGLNSHKGTWNTYADYATNRGWRVFRTNVSRDGSIKTRATELANYINGLNIEDESLTAVGHSMGGLDLRYIVSRAHDGDEPYYSAAKKIRDIYTIATPHKGNVFGGLNTSSGAYKDLGKNQMLEFNKEYPYSTLEVDGIKKPLIALRFVCGTLKSFGTDGVVNITNQSLDGAPFKLIPVIGEHTNGTSLCKGSGASEELKNTDILDNILNDNYGTQDSNDLLLTHRDIVFYDDYNCKGAEIGSFNSLYDTDVDCSKSNKCLDNSAKSVMLYPSMKKGKIIKVYPDASGRSNYCHMRIKRNTQDLKAPVCINGFEHSTTTNEASDGIETKFYKINRYVPNYLNGMVSHITIYDGN